jgi:hypothetical protein
MLHLALRGTGSCLCCWELCRHKRAAEEMTGRQMSSCSIWGPSIGCSSDQAVVTFVVIRALLHLAARTGAGHGGACQGILRCTILCSTSVPQQGGV